MEFEQDSEEETDDDKKKRDDLQEKDGSEEEEDSNESDSDSGTVFSDEIEWESDSESENKKQPTSQDMPAKSSKRQQKTPSTSNGDLKPSTSTKIQSKLKENTDLESDKSESVVKDEYEEGDTSDEEVSDNTLFP